MLTDDQTGQSFGSYRAMSFDRASKDESLLEVLDGLVRGMSPCAIVVRDHWDGDRFAVGVSSEAHPERLVYISTFETARGRCYFEREPPQAGASPRPGDEVDLPSLLDVVRAHLF
jgi:hypothetical protein